MQPLKLQGWYLVTLLVYASHCWTLFWSGKYASTCHSPPCSQAVIQGIMEGNLVYLLSVTSSNYCRLSCCPIVPIWFILYHTLHTGDQNVSFVMSRCVMVAHAYLYTVTYMSIFLSCLVDCSAVTCPVPECDPEDRVMSSDGCCSICPRTK